MGGFEKGAKIDIERAIEIMEDSTLDKVDKDLIEDMVKKYAVKKPDDANEDYPDEINFENFCQFIPGRFLATCNYCDVQFLS